MSELLREIEEDIRAERTQRLWDRFGKTLIRVSIAVLVGTVAGVTWKNYQESQATERTSQLLSGLDKVAQGEYKESIAVFGGLTEGNSIHAEMALLHKGQAEEALSDHAAAAGTYQALAARDSGSVFTALGTLLATQEPDAPITVAKDAPLVHLQQERRAWQLLQVGKKDEAEKLFIALRDDETAPQTLRLRATTALSTLAPAAGTSDE